MKRLLWIDVIRGMAFLMVIFNHLDYENIVAMRYFSPVFLTSFFFVSGYLFKDGSSFIEVLEQRIRTLLLPFVLLGSLMVLTSEFFSINDTHVGLKESFMELFVQYGHAHINTMWFIPSLFFYSIVFYFLLKLSKKWCDIMVAILCFVVNWIYIYIIKGINLPYELQWTGFACFYMYIGVIYKKHELMLANYVNLRSCFIGLLIYVFFITILDKSGCYYFNFYGSPFFIDALMLTILGIWIMLCLAKFVRTPFLRFVGANSLLYFAFHGKAMSFVNYLFDNVLFVNSFFDSFYKHELLLILKTVLGAFLLIPVCLFFNNYFPKVLGKGFKLW